MGDDDEAEIDGPNGSEEEEYDIDTYRHALEDARRTFDQQLDAFNDVGEKAWRIVQLNGLVATIYVAAIANAWEGLTFSTPSTVTIILGMGLLGLSVIYAVVGQEAQRVPIGQGPAAFEGVRHHDPKEIAYLYTTLKAFESGITDVGNKTELNGYAVNKSKRAFLLGVGLITAGTVVAVVL